ncbi:DUF429 domain-containing protein [Thermomicrobium sp. 4228-Ro]|uniref:DUF429 domain-containing protein n=1 Tax=Thermomicrobium sp. 4228-Ro TaxID=2993937 RepID=UPI0022497DE7|nr:DUF429 domain-containing protein [Thermomicrobium sp. 4228-Ro]MCX2726415.1 DUF429 domain-containing protein [Thermomicrobium sp. 4228-Ro]
MIVFESLIGIDFSAAKDASKRIWIARATPRGERLHIDAVHSAAERFGRTRPHAIDGLVSFLATSAGSLVACDACFGLPLPLVEQPWKEWIHTYPSRFPTAETLRAAGRTADGHERRRLTDRVAGAPFAPTNLRLYRQTDLWLRCILGELVRREVATIAPFQEPEPPKPHLIEVCPAVSLRTWGLPYRGYKGRELVQRAMRSRIARALLEFGIDCSPDVLARLVEQPGGDALDAVLAVVTAWLVSRDGSLQVVLPPEAYREGWIFTGHRPPPAASSR